jgi:hypothetical protein
MTRRTLLGGLAATTAFAQQRRERKEWKPRLGVLGPFTEANVKFCFGVAVRAKSLHAKR